MKGLGGAVVLSDSILNYRFLDIYAITNDQEIIYTRLAAPFVGMKFSLNNVHIGYSAIWVLTKAYQFLSATMCNMQTDDITPENYQSYSGNPRMYRGGNWNSGSPSAYNKSADLIGIYRIEGLR